jgi:ring-1,2-phenylacetyl-CoA epoxidase subunit PaaE
MVREGLAGRTPSPLVSRTGGARVWPTRSAAPATPSERPASPSEAPARPQPMEVRLGGVSHRVSVAPGATLLEAGLAEGLPMPYSCTVGGCGSCQVMLLSGDVRMDEPHCLTGEERAKGWVLACVARPVCPVTVEVP